MFHHIFIPLDGSLRAERVLPVAARIARSRNATLIVARVILDPPEVGAYMVPAIMPDDALLAQEEHEAQEYLTGIAASPELRGLIVKTYIGVGSPTRVILDAISSTHADGVIMGSHGRTGLARWALGSVAQTVVRHSTAPVLLVRQQGATLSEDEMLTRPLRILIPLDGSDLAEAALGPAQLVGEAIAASRGYEMRLVRVIPFSNTPGADASRDRARADAESYLKALAERFSAAAPVTTSVILDADPADALARMTRAGEQVTGAPDTDGYDLIAMATHGRTGFARMAVGSVTERVLSATVAPALIIRPDAMKPESHLAAAKATTDPTHRSQPALN
jgi:nucleotide-binding universal stress UspA family protein